MLTHRILEDRGIVIVEPQSALTAEDFQGLEMSVDAYLQKNPWIHGLMIYTKEFPGWENWDGFASHFKFVKNHHEEIEKVALVTDAKIASIGEKIAKHFVSAEMKHFSFSEYEDALAWL
ncbi:STAS/SEC14 domain-containing protein [Rubritalea sp.]|uniref:STAS/SEC14 domain-containing protein n=1 Tax=Rubritalea sp. TaxID=2109375 RepID=UPI003EF96489